MHRFHHQSKTLAPQKSPHIEEYVTFVYGLAI
jgi:hypothetical protein